MIFRFSVAGELLFVGSDEKRAVKHIEFFPDSIYFFAELVPPEDVKKKIRRHYFYCTPNSILDEIGYLGVYTKDDEDEVALLAKGHPETIYFYVLRAV